MPNSLIRMFAAAAILIILGIGLGLLRRDQFSIRWLLVAAGLAFLNDCALTNGYGVLPDMFRGSGWNWQGKLLALALTLAVASHPAFGWRRSGLTLVQNMAGWKVTFAVAAIVCLVFIGFAISMSNEPLDHQTLAFQLTMPGLEEEPFYRGILLLAFNETLRGRIRMLGIDLGWGALLSCVAFGLGHAFDYSHNGWSFDLMSMALTALPAFILVWLRERTGSLVLPVLLHNFGNSIFLVL
ncbi:MAG: CPBP family intramembrane glutamic endopeptidase [Pseudomonadota bacterium]|uniref:CPBP family intramembrane glutamic endopeptidase, BDIM_20840 family n=1 Tax=Sphingomonas sp. ERG5 TaxID=1381597 RepID=UPI001F45F1E8|nr:CPBP family intramembrane glutamic endopeptidase [Sphingomonas sp. ERG5]